MGHAAAAAVLGDGDPRLDGRRVRRRHGPRRITFLTESQLHRLVVALKEPRDLALASVLSLQGLRSNEAHWLNLEDVRFGDMDLYVSHAKGGKDRTMPLDELVSERILEWLAVRPEPLPGHEQALFLSRERRRLANRTIRADAKRWCKLAGLEKLWPHALRHTFGTTLASHEVPLDVIRDLMGHENTSTTSIYLHNAPNRLRKHMVKTR